MKKNGYTIIELVVGVSVLVLLAVMAMTILSRSMSSTARVESERLLDENAKMINDWLTRFIREGEVIMVNENDKEECLENGSVSGDDLTIRAIDGYDTLIALNDGVLASNEAELHLSSLTMSNFVVIWECGQGLPDRVDVSFSLSLTTGSMGIVEDKDSLLSTKSYNLSVVARNKSE